MCLNSVPLKRDEILCPSGSKGAPPGVVANECGSSLGRYRHAECVHNLAGGPFAAFDPAVQVALAEG
jgi:hypothetical protein